MTESLRTPGLGDRLRQLGYLLKNTFTLVGRDPGIVRPLVRMAVYGTVMATLFFIALLCLGVGATGLGVTLLLVATLLFLYKFFYYNRQELRQSWLATELVQGRTRTASEAAGRVAELRSTARALAWLDILFAWIGRFTNRGGKFGWLVGLLARGLVEVWDLANHYLLPAAAADGL
ncbi:MAG: hypothetical protein R3323_10710, partial [Wenzhouxiangellaceae bacterium]|nr:hypothetical protein [Wenzhouxiangellaceae bacterium]